MSLDIICSSLMDIEEDMMNGRLSFTIDKLMMAMKSEHPAMILDHILEPVFLPNLYGQEVSLQAVIDLSKNLKEYQECFNVERLDSVIDDIDEYIKENKK